MAAVHDAKAGGHHAPVDLDAMATMVSFGNGLEHGRDDHGAGSGLVVAVQAEERGDPVIRDAVPKLARSMSSWGKEDTGGKSGVSSIIFVLRADRRIADI